MTVHDQQPLRGMTWRHVRGEAPLIEAGRQTGVAVEWEARSLADFEDVPIADLAAEYDLIAIDHPHVGQAAASGALLALDEVLEPAVLAEHRANVVGVGAGSYEYAGHQWAVAMDAAVQVSAWVPDRLDQPPGEWNAVIDLLRDSTRGVHATMPANPTHLFSSFISLCHDSASEVQRLAADDQRPAWWPSAGLDAEVAATAWERLRELVDLLDPRSLQMNPIDLLDEMSSGGPADYAPLIFGYSNYARPGFAEVCVRFGDAPGSAGTMTGGVGLAISGRCQDQQSAIRLLSHVISADFQASSYGLSGGQPAHRKAWLDERLNEVSSNFFVDTLSTVDNGFLRGRDDRYPTFQRDVGNLLHDQLRLRRPAAAVIADINQRWRQR